jgi:hypothetical protein
MPDEDWSVKEPPPVQENVQADKYFNIGRRIDQLHDSQVASGQHWSG